MSMMRKLKARGRLKSARQRVAQDPSPRTYAELAQEYALLGFTRDVFRVCQEGLELFPGNSQLVRLQQRAKRLEREERMGELREELAEAPRPALWAEMCEILLEAGRFARADEVAQEWLRASGDDESRLMVARIAYESFLSVRGRDQGRRALAAMQRAAESMESDVRPRKMLLEFFSRIGAWRDAQNMASELLQLAPGDPELEARFRRLQPMSEKAPVVEHALVEVENSGVFADEGDGAPVPVAAPSVNVRPVLEGLAEERDVEAAMYARGSTVLVKGLKGATADRFARAVRTVLSSGRTTGRKLGLGQVLHVRLEGEFGTLGIAPGDLDAGALWLRGPLRREREEALMSLAGLNAETGEAES